MVLLETFEYFQKENISVVLRHVLSLNFYTYCNSRTYKNFYGYKLKKRYGLVKCPKRMFYQMNILIIYQ